MFRDIKVGFRLGLGFGLMLVFMVAIIAVSLHQERIGYEKLDRIVKINQTHPTEREYSLYSKTF